MSGYYVLTPNDDRIVDRIRGSLIKRFTGFTFTGEPVLDRPLLESNIHF
jgi:hypothetical protein